MPELITVLVIGLSIVLLMYVLPTRWYTKGSATVKKQAARCGFSVHTLTTLFATHNPQWTRNISQSGLLTTFFGNWDNVHGTITPISFYGLKTYKSYEVELLYFVITYTQEKSSTKKSSTKQPIGPYTGVHFNLNSVHPEVDIIYKQSTNFRKIYEFFATDQTVKPKQWQTESPEFNKSYAILSKEHITNLTVLTPDVMAMIIDAKLRLNIELIDNHLLVYTSKKFTTGTELETMLALGWRIAENLE